MIINSQGQLGTVQSSARFKDKIEPIRKLYPQIVIDCPPTLGLLTVNALTAASNGVNAASDLNECDCDRNAANSGYDIAGS